MGGGIYDAGKLEQSKQTVPRQSGNILDPETN